MKHNASVEVVAEEEEVAEVEGMQTEYNNKF